MQFSKNKLTVLLSIFIVLFQIDTFSQQKQPTESGAGRIPGAPESPAGRAVQINPDDQKTNDSLVNARYNKELGVEAQQEEDEIEAKKVAYRKRIFGTEVFNNKNLKFEPNLNMATPVDYRLGPGDVLKIDIYGYSQKPETAKIQPDGYIMLDKAGLVNVSGLTIEEAKSRIKSALSRFYLGLGSDTQINVSLGDIRTIRVTVVGKAVNPGTYAVPSLASVMNVLYLAGGPSEVGSFRKIEVIRNNKSIAKIDLYDFIQKGLNNDDIRLTDNDRILINPYTSRVEMTGEIKSPGIFEVIEGETLKKAIEMAGGFTENAYTNRINIRRNTDRERKWIGVTQKDFETFTLKTGDSLNVGKILNRFENQVSINGAVFRPGEYSLDDNPTLLSLIKNADGVREDAYLSKVKILRLKPDLTVSTVTVDLGKVINNEEQDITLMREDRIEISSNFDLKETFTIGVQGEVNKIGIVDPVTQENILPRSPYYNDMRLSDAIIFANGLKESAAGGSIDVTRRKKKSGAMDDLTVSSDLGNTFTFKIKSNLTLDEKDANFLLEPFDEVFVRASPNYETQQFVKLVGQVVKQGPYGLERKDERISNLIKRAGGLTSFAYIEGATLVRKTKLTQQEIENKRKQLQTLNDAKNAVLEVENVAEITVDRIGIDLEKAIEKPGSNFDVILQDGDELNIPKKPSTVKLSGEVLYPNTTQFDDSYSFKEYIGRAGGFTSLSMRKKSHILYANGSVARTKRFLGINLYPKVRPGSEIIVPKKVKTTSMAEVFGSIQGITGVLTTLITTFLLINNLK